MKVVEYEYKNASAIPTIDLLTTNKTISFSNILTLSLTDNACLVINDDKINYKNEDEMMFLSLWYIHSKFSQQTKTSNMIEINTTYIITV